MSNNMKAINDEALENVVGGASRQIDNKASKFSNLRKGPGLNSDVKLRLENGDWVETTGKTEKKDGYVWYEVYVIGAEDCGGWIAGSLIGF